jgi:hypothetical protein
MDSLGALPVSILLDILKLVPSLPGLHNLRRASPAVDRLLREDELVTEVLEAIVTSKLHYDTQVTVRFAVLTAYGPHSGNLLLEDPDKLREVIWGRSYSARWQRDNYANLAGHQPLTNLPHSPQLLLAVHRVIALSVRVQQLGHSCFHAMLDRVVASSPRRPKEPAFTYTEYERAVKIAYNKGAAFPDVKLPEPETEPISIPAWAMAAPTWAEEYRFEHDAWAFALDSLIPKDPASDWAKPVRQIFEPPTSLYPKWWAYDTVSTCLPAPPPETLRAAIASLEAALPTDEARCCRSPPLKDPGEGWQPAEWGGEQDTLLQSLHISTGGDFVQQSRSWHPWNPLFKCPGTTWRRLGLERTWSRRRMEGFGFLPGGNETGPEPQNSSVSHGHNVRKTSIPDAIFAWRSVLPDDELQAMHERAEDWWTRKVLRS